MNNSGKQCYNCKNFSRYYTKGLKKFDATKVGLCYVKCGVVNSHDCCDKMVYKPKSKRISQLVEHTLNDLLTEISELRKIIEEEDESEQL